MAKEYVLVLTDDIDGGEATETVTFGLDGEMLEVDLNEENARKLKDAIRPFALVARPAAPKQRAKSSGAGKKKAQGNPELKKIREWAQENGYNVAPQGRISQEIQQAYYATAGQ